MLAISVFEPEGQRDRVVLVAVDRAETATLCVCVGGRGLKCYLVRCTVTLPGRWAAEGRGSSACGGRPSLARAAFDSAKTRGKSRTRASSTCPSPNATARDWPK